MRLGIFLLGLLLLVGCSPAESEPVSTPPATDTAPDIQKNQPGVNNLKVKEPL